MLRLEAFLIWLSKVSTIRRLAQDAGRLGGFSWKKTALGDQAYGILG
jgi:hypothetical protein